MLKTNNKSMKIKFALFTVLMIFAVVALSSCDKSMDEPVWSVKDETDMEFTENRNNVTVRSSISYMYMINLSSYSHLQQPSIPGVALTCGQTSYLVARRIANPQFAPPTEQNVINLDRILLEHFDGSYGVTRTASVRHLTWFAEQYDGFSPEIFQKEERPKRGTKTPNHSGAIRQQFKAFIERKLSQGKVVIVPCTFHLSSSPSSTGHYYIVVGLRNNAGTLEIGLKDVFYASPATSWESYTEFLDANWYNQAGWRWVASGQYYTSDYVAYSLQ